MMHLISLPLFALVFSRSLHVTISVQDQNNNNNAPTIHVNTLTTSGHAEVEENLPPGSYFAHVSVTDADTGSSGQVTCALVGAGRLFALQPLVGSTSTQYNLVTSTPLDRERRDEYQLTIVCRDAGVPALSQSRDLVVRVVDTNDNAPQFDRRSYTASVSEDSIVGQPLLRLNATDQDAGRNGQIEFSLCDLSPDSMVNQLVAVSADGLLFTAAVLDYERIHQVRFCVMAVDGGQPRRSAKATVTLNIVDVNDNPPRFTQSTYTFVISEHQPAGTEVGLLVAVDADDAPPHNRVVYRVVSETPPIGAFFVDRRSGRLVTTRVLDRERTAIHRLVVAATDVGTPPLWATANVAVFVADLNDNIPVIIFPRPGNSTVRVSRYAPVGYVITRMSVRDADFGINAMLRYDIIEGDDRATVGKRFMIDTRGVIAVASDLQQADGDRYDLLLVVTDMGTPPQSASAILTINVVDTAWP